MKKTLFLAIFSLLALPTFAFATIDTNLKYGAKGDEVVELQEFLIDKGFLQGTATGNFFALTKKAVISYQSSVGLPATGFVGQLTRAEINKELQNDDQAEIQETGAVSEPVKTSQTDVLKAQLDSLIAQINALKEEQKKTTEQAQQTTQAVQQVVQNTVKPVVLGGAVAESKPVIKRIELKTSGLPDKFVAGGRYFLYPAYYENDKEVSTTMTITSDNPLTTFCCGDNSFVLDNNDPKISEIKFCPNGWDVGSIKFEKQKIEDIFREKSITMCAENDKPQTITITANGISKSIVAGNGKYINE